MTRYYSEHSQYFVSVDCIVFGFDEGKLKLLIGRRQMDPGRGEWSLYGGFGMTMEIPLKSSLRSSYFVNSNYEASDRFSIRAPWQFSTSLGVGVQYQFTPSVGLFAEPSLQYFLPSHSEIETYRTEHPFVFSLPLGIRITLK